MSIRLMTMVWDVRFPTQSQLLIALKLADYANDEGGSIYPARARLADQAQCSETTVKNALRVFREIGLLHVLEQGGKGPKDTTIYAFNMRLMKALQLGHCTIEGSSEEAEIKWAEKGAEFDPLVDLRGQPSDLRGQPANDKGAAGCPQSIINHHIEPSGARAGACVTSATPARAEARDTQPDNLKGSVVIHPGDPEWPKWMAWADVHAKRWHAIANRIGVICVNQREPPPMALTDRSRAMTADAA